MRSYFGGTVHMTIPSSELALYFAADGVTIYDAQIIKTIAHDAVRALTHVVPDHVQKQNGNTLLTQQGKELFTQLAFCIRSLSSRPDIMRLPNTNAQRAALVQTLLRQLLEKSATLRYIAPVCPDYGEGEQFHARVNKGIGQEADAAIQGSTLVTQVMNDAGMSHEVTILVADTETDHADIMQRCSAGNIEAYIENCQENVGLIAIALAKLGIDGKVRVSSFSAELQPRFHHMQHQYEAYLLKQLKETGPLSADIIKIGRERRKRHSQILGREELDYELTIRYIAQYAALGKIVSAFNVPAILMNYPTPNTPYYNLDTAQTIPVLGTQIRRRNV